MKGNEPQTRMHLPMLAVQGEEEEGGAVLLSSCKWLCFKDTETAALSLLSFCSSRGRGPLTLQGATPARMPGLTFKDKKDKVTATAAPCSPCSSRGHGCPPL